MVRTTRVTSIQKADGSAGDAEVFVEHPGLLTGMDGIIFGSDGKIYAANILQDSVISISPNKAISVVVQGEELQNPSDVKFGVGADSDTMYIANFALLRNLGLVPGEPDPAILKVTVRSGVGLPSVGDKSVSQVITATMTFGLISLATGLIVLFRRKFVGLASFRRD